MKYFCSLLLLTSICSISHAQLNWQHTGGPEGVGFGFIYENEQHAFFTNLFHIYRTADGKSWERIDQSRTYNIVSSEQKLIAYEDLKYPAGGKLILSNDQGVNWSDVPMPNEIDHLSHFGIIDSTIFVIDSDRESTFKSTDDGLNWTKEDLPFRAHEVWTFDNRLFAFGSVNEDYQMWYSDATGTNWQSINIPSTSIDVININSNKIIYSSGNEYHTSIDFGNTWTSYEIADVSYIESIVEIDQSIYFLLSDGKVIQSIDFGANFIELSLFTYTCKARHISKISNQLLISEGASTMYLWNPNSEELMIADSGLTASTIHDLEKDNQGRLWAATGNGIFKKEPNSSWEKVLDNQDPCVGYSSIETSEIGAIVAWTKAGFPILVSEDNGQSWEPRIYSNFLSNTQIKRKVIDSLIFITNFLNSHLTYSHNLGKTFIPFQDSFYDIIKWKGKYIINSGILFYESEDGINWSEMEIPFERVFHLFKENGKLFAVVSRTINGKSRTLVYRSTDLVNWEYAHDGLPTIKYIASFQGIITSSLSNSRHSYLHIADNGLYQYDTIQNVWYTISNERLVNPILIDDQLYRGDGNSGVLQTNIPISTSQIYRGNVYFDDNNNGLKDADEKGVSDIKVGMRNSLFNHSLRFFNTDPDGSYVVGTAPGDSDTLNVIFEHPHFVVQPPFFDVTNESSPYNFGIQAPVEVSDLSIFAVLQKEPRPGFESKLSIIAVNNGSIDKQSKITLTLDDLASYKSAVPEPTSISGNQLEWNIDLDIFEKQSIRVSFTTKTSAALGSPVKFDLKIDPTFEDITPANNQLTLCDTVVGSFDPNDKLVHPAEGLTAEEIETGQDIIYTVRFQNTGTFPAEKVRIVDQIDTALNIRSLRLIGASHPIESFQIRNDRVLEVNFDPIFLPDSTNNEPESHGFVSFAIQRNKNYRENYKVKNFASIFFDFNDPIVTNEVTFGIPSISVSTTPYILPKNHNELKISPNPTKNTSLLELKNRLLGPANISIFHSSGKQVLFERWSNTAVPYMLNTTAMAAGIYIIKITDGNQVVSNKMIKME